MLKKIGKIVIRMILSYAFIYIFNYFMSKYQFVIPVNYITIVIIGLFGVKGLIFLIIIKTIL